MRGRQLVLACILAAGPLSAASRIWVGFRYDATHVLIYDAEKRDESRYRQAEVDKRQLPAPLARWGGGGYLLPLAAAGKESPGVGEVLTLALGKESTISATVDGYVEQWGSSNPIVKIGVLLRVNPGQLLKFHASKADYFLVRAGESSSALTVDQNYQASIPGAPSVLNRFGLTGELRLVELDAGWRITLWRRENRKLAPTSVKYSYGE